MKKQTNESAAVMHEIRSLLATSTIDCHHGFVTRGAGVELVASIWPAKENRPELFDVLLSAVDADVKPLRLDGMYFYARNSSGDSILLRQGRLTSRGHIAIDELPRSRGTYEIGVANIIAPCRMPLTEISDAAFVPGPSTPRSRQDFDSAGQVIQASVVIRDFGKVEISVETKDRTIANTRIRAAWVQENTGEVIHQEYLELSVSEEGDSWYDQMLLSKPIFVSEPCLIVLETVGHLCT